MADISPSDCEILTPPQPRDLARLTQGPRRFLLTIDTEEDFDWAAPLSRDGYRLDSLAELPRFQAFCEERGVRPTWLVDYPVATAPAAIAALAPAVATGRAAVGLQLHPWVNPPFDEVVNQHNSFAGHLPIHQERAKLLALRDVVTANFGAPPQIYRAGRYGVGPNTAALLRDAGIAIDSSVRAFFDYRRDGGPGFTRLGAWPWWVGESGAGGLLELPLTSVFTGALRRYGPALFPPLGWVEATRAVTGRLGLLARIPLTPEGTSVAEALAAIDQAVADDLPVQVLSFHSPSLLPGCTPYARDVAERDALYGWFGAVFAHLAEHGVQCATPDELLAALA